MAEKITVKHYKDIVLEKHKILSETSPVTGFKRILLLHGNVPALASELVTAFWKI